jgi:hypothetical protein
MNGHRSRSKSPSRKQRKEDLSFYQWLTLLLMCLSLGVEVTALVITLAH